MHFAPQWIHIAPGTRNEHYHIIYIYKYINYTSKSRSTSSCRTTKSPPLRDYYPACDSWPSSGDDVAAFFRVFLPGLKLGPTETRIL